ncbi:MULTISPECIES: M61 family metallopeptidase [unclassified Moraxella]|uniref:M61 family metallopeptidase n=1 Tax=unclassified Moraxella TaxID=2685852 RepID=UPI003AF98458
MTIHYQFNFARFREHLVDVTLTFTAHEANPTLWLPAWIAGSYMIREFSKHITAVSATIDNQTQRLNKLDKNHWQITAQQGNYITVHYEVYAYDLSVRGAYVDETRLYGNFTSLALAVQGQEHQPIQAELLCPQDFIDVNGVEVSLATALADKMHQQRTQTIYQLQADNYEQLTDSPFEIAEQDEFWFEIINKDDKPIPHRFVISGVQQSDLERLESDLSRICQSYVDWLGDTPFDDYLFMTMATANDYGGLEHLESTSLITPRDDLPSFYEADEPSDNYQRFLGLCSHEYFHTWWVKTVRPAVFLNPNLSTEGYTNLLWVFEGFTSYVDDFMLQQSGVISQKSYLKLLAEQINRYHQTHGRALQSVAESSFDAWIKLYRSDENTPNAGISYYNKGALVALCLDLTLMQQGKRIFDVIKAFYGKAKLETNQRFGMTDANLDAMMSEFLPKQVWQDFRANYVEGTTELPLAELLTEQGVHIEKTDDTSLIWGLKVVSDPSGLKVQRVVRGSQGSGAGISANDVIVAIDGIKATEKWLKSTAKTQAISEDTVVCHIFRRDELLVLEVEPVDEGSVVNGEKWVLKAQDKLGWLAWN